MRRLLVIFATIVALSGGLQAQLLWEISGNKLPFKSYLFGTHHLVPASYLDSVQGLYTAFNSCRMVVGELVVNDPAMLKKMTDGAKMPTYITMRELFSEADYALVDSALQSVLNMGLKELALLKPAMISNLYTMALYQHFCPIGSDDWQLDSFFQQLATQMHVPVVGLETVDEQIALLYNSQTLERQAFLLVGAVQQATDIGAEIAEVNRLYREGNLDGLFALYDSDTTQYAATQQEKFALLDDRNATWARHLPNLMATHPCFIAVGALHLAGENGLVALLRQAGYKVRPVRK